LLLGRTHHAGTATDCNTNGVLDECELLAGNVADCNENGLPDECDIAGGTSQDGNQNGTPDECEEIPLPYRVEYGYDYMGRKIRRQFFEWDAVGAAWVGPVMDTKYVYNGWTVIEELNGVDPVTPDATTRQYTWGLDLAAQAGAVNSLEQAGGIGGLLAAYDTAGTSTTADDRTFVYFYDANGNVGQVVETTLGSAGTIVAHYEYTPYGQVLVEPLFDQPYRFSTKPFDSWTGLGYWGYRWYSPKLGRWVNRDPIEEEGGWNLYIFGGNGLPQSVDAIGLAWTIERRANWRRAKVVGQCGDTVAALAPQINMDPSIFSFWLRQEDGKGIPSTAEEGLTESNREFSVPNVVFVGVGNMNWLAATFTGRTPPRIVVALLNKEFMVDYQDWDDFGPWDAQRALDYGDDLYGLVYFGHGVAPGKPGWRGKGAGDDGMTGWLDPGGGGSAGYIIPEWFVNRQFGLLILKACYASNGGWRAKVSRNGVVWLGNGMEAAGFDSGILGVAAGAK